MTRMSRPILVLVVGLLLAAPAAAEPIAVFTQVWSAGNGTGDEIRVTGLGEFAVLTTGGGVGPTLTLAADQTTARQAVVGFWPVMGFKDLAQYEAQRGSPVTVPNTPVRLYAEVWGGAYGGSGVPVQRVFIDATVSGTVGAGPGQNVVSWQFPDTPTVVRFGDTTVTLTYTPVVQPDGLPQIQFADGAPAIGWPGPIYYPTLLDLTITTDRPPTDPTDPGTPTDPPGSPGDPGSGPAAPEPATLLLAGLGLAGLAVRRRR